MPYGELLGPTNSRLSSNNKALYTSHTFHSVLSCADKQSWIAWNFTAVSRSSCRPVHVKRSVNLGVVKMRASQAIKMQR